jgi:hypothetical protein
LKGTKDSQRKSFTGGFDSVNRFLRSFFALLVLLAGSFALASGTGYAEPGGFDVPKVNEDFDQFEHNPGPQKQQPIHNTDVQAEEKGFWDKTAEFFKDGWEWVSEKGSEFIHWTKEKVAAFWEEIKSIISKITDVAVNALASFGNWIMEHKGIALIVLTIVGIVAAVVGFVVGAAVAVTTGVSILFGILVSGIISWISGNELFGDEMLTDMLLGGVIGVLSALFGWAAGSGAIASNVGRWLGTRIPWLGKAFPKMFGGAVGAGVDQSLWDIFKTGKINWKNTAIAAVFGFGIVFGGEYISKNSDDIIRWINNREVPSFSQSLVMSGDSAALTSPTRTRIGDTPFGQWLQKFSARNQNSVNATQLRNSPGTVSGGINAPSVEKMMRGTQGNIGVIPKEVADQLRGRDFSNFNEFRSAFWRAVANSRYASEFSASNISRMRSGKAPFTLPQQWHGGQRNYVLHHRKPIHDGGGVYDLDNLIIVTPKMHQEILDKKYHFGR